MVKMLPLQMPSIHGCLVTDALRKRKVSLQEAFQPAKALESGPLW
jgi:hypothetical protein